jgi:hypothetical protein
VLSRILRRPILTATAHEPDVYGDVPSIPADFQPMPTLNHANRSRNNVAAVPTPAQVRKARLAADLTPGAAGALIHERATRWAKFESGEAHMHPAAWELFNLKLAQRHGGELAASSLVDVTDDLDGLARAVWGSDGAPRNMSEATIRGVLDNALRCRLGIACLGNRVASVDLGNGHALVCRVVEQG